MALMSKLDAVYVQSYGEMFVGIPLWLTIIQSRCELVLLGLLGIMMGISCLYSSVGWYKSAR